MGFQSSIAGARNNLPASSICTISIAGGSSRFPGIAVICIGLGIDLRRESIVLGNNDYPTVRDGEAFGVTRQIEADSFFRRNADVFVNDALSQPGPRANADIVEQK